MTAPQPVRTHRSALETRPLWLVGLAATVAGAAVTALVAAVARAADVPLEVASSSDAAPEAIPVSGVAVLVVIGGIVGVVMALGTNRWATRPARAFVAATTVSNRCSSRSSRVVRMPAGRAGLPPPTIMGQTNSWHSSRLSFCLTTPRRHHRREVGGRQRADLVGHPHPPTRPHPAHIRSAPKCSTASQ
jgi:hypothetical protein